MRARNAARLELLADRVRSQSVAGRELRVELGISRQRMQQLRESGRLLGVQPPLRTEYWYPRWQFRGGEVHEVLPRLLAAARERGLSPLGLHLVLTDADAGIGAKPRLGTASGASSGSARAAASGCSRSTTVRR